MTVITALIYQKWASKQTEDVRKAENTKQSSSHFKCAYKNKVNVVVNEILYTSYVRQGNVLQILLNNQKTKTRAKQTHKQKAPPPYYT